MKVWITIAILAIIGALFYWAVVSPEWDALLGIKPEETPTPTAQAPTPTAVPSPRMVSAKWRLPGVKPKEAVDIRYDGKRIAIELHNVSKKRVTFHLTLEQWVQFMSSYRMVTRTPLSNTEAIPTTDPAGTFTMSFSRDSVAFVFQMARKKPDAPAPDPVSVPVHTMQLFQVVDNMVQEIGE